MGRTDASLIPKMAKIFHRNFVLDCRLLGIVRRPTRAVKHALGSRSTILSVAFFTGNAAHDTGNYKEVSFWKHVFLNNTLAYSLKIYMQGLQSKRFFVTIKYQLKFIFISAKSTCWQNFVLSYRTESYSCQQTCYRDVCCTGYTGSGCTQRNVYFS